MNNIDLEKITTITCDDDDPEPDDDPADDEYGEDCPSVHACTRASTSWGYCIAGSKGHAGMCLCGKCGMYF